MYNYVKSLLSLFLKIEYIFEKYDDHISKN